MRAREETMRNTNESTHGRVAFFSLLSLGILGALGGVQLTYMKRYFKAKKLI